MWTLFSEYKNLILTLIDECVQHRGNVDIFFIRHLLWLQPKQDYQFNEKIKIYFDSKDDINNFINNWKKNHNNFNNIIVSLRKTSTDKSIDLSLDRFPYKERNVDDYLEATVLDMNDNCRICFELLFKIRSPDDIKYKFVVNEFSLMIDKNMKGYSLINGLDYYILLGNLSLQRLEFNFKDFELDDECKNYIYKLKNYSFGPFDIYNDNKLVTFR